MRPPYFEIIVHGAYYNYLCSNIPGVTSAGFRNGFHGFCGVFVNAAFAYTGTELTGLAAAETENPRKEIPKASKQVIYRILLFYVVNLALVGLVVPVDNEALNGSAGASSLHSPFVIAIQLAGIKVLPSIFNAVILIAVMSVANACTFGSTRTMQALAANGKSATLHDTVFKLITLCLQAWVPKSPHTSTRKVDQLLLW